MVGTKPPARAGEWVVRTVGDTSVFFIRLDNLPGVNFPGTEIEYDENSLTFYFFNGDVDRCFKETR